MSSFVSHKNINKPVAHRSPSPDVLTSNQIPFTKALEFKSPNSRSERVPLIEQIMNLTKQNIKLRQMLNGQVSPTFGRELEQKNKQIRQLRNQLHIILQKSNKKLTITLNNSELRSLGNSTQRKRRISELSQDSKQQVFQLKKKVFQLEKDNTDLKNALNSRSVINSKDSTNLSITRNQIFKTFDEQISNLQKQADYKIKQLQLKISQLEKILPSKANHISLLKPSRKISIITSSKKNGFQKQSGEDRFNTPNKRNRFSNFEQTISKQNLYQLERQNKLLLQQNTQVKRAYDQLVIKINSSQASSPQRKDPKRNIQLQNKMNMFIQDNQSLKDTLQDLRKSIQILEKQNYDLKIKLSTFNNKLQPSFIRYSQDEQSMTIQNLSRSNDELSKEKQIIQSQLLMLNQNNYKLQQSVRALQYQNQRLKKQNSTLKGSNDNFQNTFSVNKGNSKLEQIWNQLIQAKKKIEQLQLTNKRLLNQLNMKEHDRIKYQRSDERTQLLGQNQTLKIQLSNLKNKLFDADKRISQITNTRNVNQDQISKLMINLRQIQIMLGRISFVPLEMRIKQASDKYRTIFDDRKLTAKKLKQTSSQSSRLSYENDSLRRQLLQAKINYTNQSSKRQAIEIRLNQQLEKVSILNQQIRQLNIILNDHINKQINYQQSQQSVSIINQQLFDDIGLKELKEMRQIQGYVKTISINLADLIGDKNANRIDYSNIMD